MRATVIWLRDDVLTADQHEAGAITAKILPDGRAYVTAGDTTTLYRRADRITVHRDGRGDALGTLEDA